MKTQSNLIFAIVVLLILGTLRGTSIADCSPAGTWEGTWHSYDGPSGPIHAVMSCDGHVTGTMRWDLRPEGVPCVLTFEIDTNYTLGPAGCHLSFGFEDTQQCQGQNITISIDSEGNFTDCDEARGTYSGTYSAAGNTFPEAGTWELGRTSRPFKATNPNPANGATNQPITTGLNWHNCGACSFDVYLDSQSKGNQPETTYNPGELSYATTYQWHVDSVNTNGTKTGDTWHFTTEPVPPYHSDLNDDRQVDFRDFAILANHLNDTNCDKENRFCEGADLDRNGVVNLFDLCHFCESWLIDTTLLAYWKMDDNADTTTVTDSSIYANHGSAQRNTSALSTVAWLPTGRISSVLSFNGSTDYISVPDRDEWTFAGDFTIALWAKFNTFNSNWWESAFIGHDEGGGDTNKWIFSYDSTNNYTMFHIKGAGLGPTIIRGNTWTAVAGVWYFVAVSRTGSTYTFYRDGGNDGSEINATVIPNAATQLTIGWSEGDRKFDGAIDNVMIFSRALSQKEIEDLYYQ